MPGDLGRDVPDAGDIKVAIGPREGQAGREQLPDVVAVEQRDGPVPPFGERLGQPAGDGGLTRAGQPGEEDHQAALGPGRPGPPELARHARRREPGRNLGAGIQQRAELGVGQLILFGARLDQGERPPYLRTRVIGPLARADDRNRHPGQHQRAVFPGRQIRRARRAGRVRQQVSGAVGRGHDRLGAQVGGRARVPGGERDGDDERARGQVLPGREDRAD